MINSIFFILPHTTFIIRSLHITKEKDIASIMKSVIKKVWLNWYRNISIFKKLHQTKNKIAKKKVARFFKSIHPVCVLGITYVRNSLSLSHLRDLTISDERAREIGGRRGGRQTHTHTEREFRTYVTEKRNI